MIVEEQGIGFWTRVQLPSGPLAGTLVNIGFFLYLQGFSVF